MKQSELNSLLDRWVESLASAAKPKSENTLKTYRNAVSQFISFLEDNQIETVNQSAANQYKEYLLELKDKELIKTSTINSRITALNKFFIQNNMNDLKLYAERQQKRTALDDTLEETDYNRLIRWADILTNPAEYNKKNNKKVKQVDCTREKLIMQTLAGTGIRISELEFFTIEKVKKATRNNPIITVKNKGKERDVIIPAKLRKSLLQYAKQNNITSGVIFRGKPLKDVNGELLKDKNGNLIYKLVDKAWIWRKLKYIAGQARVKKSKVHAHSFRHLFAKRYMNEFSNLPELADLLGHESLETTRIYTNESSKAKQNKLDSLIK